jgi:hypothetical protein
MTMVFGLSGRTCVSFCFIPLLFPFLFLSIVQSGHWECRIHTCFVSCGSLLAVAFLSNREIGTLVYIRYIEVWAWLSLRLSVAVFVRLVKFEAELWMVCENSSWEVRRPSPSCHAWYSVSCLVRINQEKSCTVILCHSCVQITCIETVCTVSVIFGLIPSELIVNMIQLAIETHVLDHLLESQAVLNA